MDQSKSSKPSSDPGSVKSQLQRKKISMEFVVGVFTLIGVACGAYMAVGLAGLELGTSQSYQIVAEFDNISGLKHGASVEIAGVPIGKVKRIELEDPMARVVLDIDRSVQIKEDDIASIRTKGIIGDRYVKISRGSPDKPAVPESGKITDTESVVDIEDIIGKLVHSLGSDKSEKDDEG